MVNVIVAKQHLKVAMMMFWLGNSLQIQQNTVGLLKMFVCVCVHLNGCRLHWTSALEKANQNDNNGSYYYRQFFFDTVLYPLTEHSMKIAYKIYSKRLNKRIIARVKFISFGWTFWLHVFRRSWKVNWTMYVNIFSVFRSSHSDFITVFFVVYTFEMYEAQCVWFGFVR